MQRATDVGANRGAVIKTVKSGADITGAEMTPRSELELARASEYLLLANLLQRAPGNELLADLAGLRGDASPLGIAHLQLADAAGRASTAGVGTEYMALFIGVGRGEIVPYGSYYQTGFLHERPLARVREDLDRFGIERQSGVHEPEDHIAALFEVMAGLCSGAFTTDRGASDRFFKRHIAPWAPRLMADIANAPSARFYSRVALLGQLWLEIEAESMKLPD